MRDKWQPPIGTPKRDTKMTILPHPSCFHMALLPRVSCHSFDPSIPPFVPLLISSTLPRPPMSRKPHCVTHLTSNFSYKLNLPPYIEGVPKTQRKKDEKGCWLLVLRKGQGSLSCVSTPTSLSIPHFAHFSCFRRSLRNTQSLFSLPHFSPSSDLLLELNRGCPQTLSKATSAKVRPFATSFLHIFLFAPSRYILCYFDLRSILYIGYGPMQNLGAIEPLFEAQNYINATLGFAISMLTDKCLGHFRILKLAYWESLAIRP